MKKIILVLVSISLLFFSCTGKKDTSRAPHRENALSGDPITPKDFPANLLPGIDDPGVVPLKKYFIVEVNGDMSNIWRLNHVQDIERYGNMYAERFGIRFEYDNSGNDSELQVKKIKALLEKKPDLLIFSANEAAPLDVIYEECEKAKIPFMTIDRAIKTKAWDNPDDMYICHLSMDFMLQGVAEGKVLVDYLKKKNGIPKGNVVEIAANPKSQPGLQRSQGLNIVLDKYKDIRIIETGYSYFERQKAYEIMKGFLEKYPAGMIDAVVTGNDEGNLGALDAIKEAGRDELLRPQFGVDGIREALEKILEDEFYMTIETPPYFGMLAFEYGIRYLNGEDIPDLIMLPMRVYTPNQKDLTRKHAKLMKENKIDFPLLDWGGQKELILDLSDYYPKNWIENPELAKYPAFQNQEPIK